MNHPSHCILTFSRMLIDPLNARPEQILIEDIAHSLSLMTRANGHFKQFYSVAQHCVNCAREAQNREYSKRLQLACLLHDAAKAYVADIPRPVKQRLTGFAEIEDNILAVILRKFGLDDLTDEDWQSVKSVDDALLHAEFETLMGIQLFKTAPFVSMTHDYSLRDMEDVYREFIRLFRVLSEPAAETVNRTVVGVDGCKGGWAVAVLAGDQLSLHVYKHIADVFNAHADAERILIDMPIGLPEGAADLPPEPQLRALLRGKASSVFNRPCRQATYADAQHAAVNKAVLGKALSAQSIGIIPKIRELDEHLCAHPEHRARIFESHPELVFAKLSGAPVMEKKREPDGERKRLSILSPFIPTVHTVIAHSDIKKQQAAADDMIDAVCLAVAARLSLTQPLLSVPERPQLDAHGLAMQVVYVEA